MASIDVLIVDDNRAVAESFGDILTGAGMSVLVTTSLGEAAEVVATNEFRAVILDHHLAEAGQVGNNSEWHANRPLPPVILVSGMHAEDLRQVQHEHGHEMYAFLAKPVAPTALIDVVSRAIG